MKIVCALFVITLGCVQASCLVDPVREGVYPYEARELSVENRELFEQWKREHIQIEDIVLGEDAIASWFGRRIAADLEVRYTDGTLVYLGPVFDLHGFQAHINTGESHRLSSGQPGIMLGLNGMAIGGKRRFIIEPELVCGPRQSHCALVGPDKEGHGTGVRKETLIVEATLTEACIPQLKVYRYGTLGTKTEVVGCRRPEYPERDPALPVWHLY